MEFPVQQIRDFNDFYYFVRDLKDYIDEIEKNDVNWNHYKMLKYNNEELQDENYKLKDELEKVDKINKNNLDKILVQENTIYQLRKEIEGLHKDIEALLR